MGNVPRQQSEPLPDWALTTARQRQALRDLIDVWAASRDLEDVQVVFRFLTAIDPQLGLHLGRYHAASQAGTFDVNAQLEAAAAFIDRWEARQLEILRRAKP